MFNRIVNIGIENWIQAIGVLALWICAYLIGNKASVFIIKTVNKRFKKKKIKIGTDLKHCGIEYDFEIGDAMPDKMGYIKLVGENRETIFFILMN